MAEELSGQAEVLAQAISFFRLGANGSAPALPSPRNVEPTGSGQGGKRPKAAPLEAGVTAPRPKKASGTRSTGIAVREKEEHRAAMAPMEPDDVAFEEF